MAKRRISYKKIGIFCFFLVLLGSTGCILFYNSNLKSVSKESKKIVFTVEKGNTYQSLSTKLKDENLIECSHVK